MLDKFFLVCCLFPFVSPYPVGSDIQPLAGILAFLLIISLLFKSRHIRKDVLFILLIPILFLSYNNPFAIDAALEFGKSISLFFGVLVFVAFVYCRNSLSGNLFTLVVSFYFIWTLLLLGFTETMISIQNYLIRDTNSTDFSYRGVSSLVTEPGLFGGLLVFFFILRDWLLKNNKLTPVQSSSIFFMLFFMLIMTKSGTGYLYFAIYFFFRMFANTSNVYTKCLSITCLLCIIPFIIIIGESIDAENLGRGASIIIKLSNPSELIGSDASILTRLVSFWIGIQSLFHFPIGVGNFSVMTAANEIMLSSDFSREFFNETGKDFGINSSFAYLTIAYGLFFIVYFGYIFFVKSKSNYVSKFFAFLFLAVSYSAAFPAIWILLALENNINTATYEGYN